MHVGGDGTRTPSSYEVGLGEAEASTAHFRVYTMASPTPLHALLPDIQSSICESFSNVECCIEQTPCLSEPPFGLGFDNLGRRIHLVPSGTAPPKDFHLIASVPEGDVIGDGQAGDTIHLILADGEDWRSPIQKLFNHNHGSAEWALLVLELQASKAHFHVLSPHTTCTPQPIENTILWIAPLSLEPPPKPRVVKKVLVKKSPDKASSTTTKTTKTSTGTTKTSTGTTKIVRKKVVTKDGVVAISSELKERSPQEGVKKVPSSEKSPKIRESAGKPEVGNGNGEGSGVDSGISLADSDTEKNRADDKERPDGSANEWVTPCSTPDSALKMEKMESSPSKDISTTFTMNLANNEPMTSAKPMATGLLNGRDEPCSLGLTSTSSRLTPPDARMLSVHQGTFDRRNPLEGHSRETPMRGSAEMPVLVLQQVLKQFTFKELGELRRVHPYWDELCGQALNSGYYEAVKKADKMLTDCQRRVHSERDLHKVLTVLTSLQVHILNPIDILRPAMDEGVCCFVYGDLLDQIFGIVAKARRMMDGEFELEVEWKPVAELARQAQIHYKSNLEAVMEEKLSDVVKLKALQRIQRIDSFIVDTTVNKLEKAATMARDDLEWEIEQLRQSNAQLRRDNRELRKDHMRLESRVEVLENKFKTMARLLQ